MRTILQSFTARAPLTSRVYSSHSLASYYEYFRQNIQYFTLSLKFNLSLSICEQEEPGEVEGGGERERGGTRYCFYKITSTSSIVKGEFP